MKKRLYWGYFIGILIANFILSTRPQTLLDLVSGPLNLVIELLRNLSLSSPLRNVIAWSVYIGISAIPIILGLWLFKKDKNNFSLGLFVGLSLFLFWSLFGLLNYLFLPSFTAAKFEYGVNTLPLLLVGIALIQFIVLIIFVRVFMLVKHNPIAVLKYGILLLAFCYAILEGMQLRWNLLLIGDQPSGVIGILGDILLCWLLFGIAADFYEFLDQYQANGFSESVIKLIEKISFSSKWLLLLSIFISLVVNISYLIAASLDISILYTVSVSVAEVFAALTALLITILVKNAYEIQKENKEFV